MSVISVLYFNLFSQLPVHINFEDAPALKNITSPEEWFSSYSERVELLKDRSRSSRLSVEHLLQIRPPPAIFKNYRKATTEAVKDKHSISLVTHLGVSRTALQRLAFTAELWKGGPVSAAVRVTDLQQLQELNQFLDSQPEDSLSIFQEFVSIHLLVEAVHPYGYPHNTLRQLALDSAETTFFLQVDVDFVTQSGGHEILSTLLRNDEYLQQQMIHNRTMLVLPAFNHEVMLDNNNLKISDLPQTKDQVIQAVNSKPRLLTPFHVSNYPVGHGATDFKKWYGLSKDKSEKYYPIDFALGFEPYVVGAISNDLPKFWTGFRGFGINKVSWFLELYYEKYHFVVARDVWVTHLNHKLTTKGTTVWNRRASKDFCRYLVNHYGAPWKDLWRWNRHNTWRSRLRTRFEEMLAPQVKLS